MHVNEAIRHAYRLQAKWVGVHIGVSYDLNRIHASMLQEHRWNMENPARCTPSCARETKGELILLGKIRKALSDSRMDPVALESDAPTTKQILQHAAAHLMSEYEPATSTLDHSHYCYSGDLAAVALLNKLAESL